VFIEDGIDPEPAQEAFIAEVRSWEHGHYTEQFGDADDLRRKVSRGIHNYVLANQTAPTDTDELAVRAWQLVSGSPKSSTGAEPSLRYA
jgi:hypothetical protein